MDGVARAGLCAENRTAQGRDHGHTLEDSQDGDPHTKCPRRWKKGRRPGCLQLCEGGSSRDHEIQDQHLCPQATARVWWGLENFS